MCSKPQIYLAGGMSGMNFHDSNAWRQQIQNDFQYDSVLVINPNDYFNFLHKDYESEKEVRDFDLNILRNSNLLIVNFNKPDSIGTAQELAIAHELHIPVLGLNENRCELHPWLRECCDRIFDSMYELIEYTRFYYIERWEA